jgi:hypothetical protein
LRARRTRSFSTPPSTPKRGGKLIIDLRQIPDVLNCLDGSFDLAVLPARPGAGSLREGQFELSFRHRR